MTAITRKDLETLINRQAPRAVLESAVTGYFRSLLRESEGVLTPKILQEADWLYDVISTRVLADILGLTTGELKKALARQRVIVCEECGERFTVIEPRCYGGYTESYERFCEECRRRHRLLAREKQRQRELEREKRGQYDAEILSAIEAGRDPLQLEKLHQHLIAYALLWIADHHLVRSGCKGCLGPGCMICAQEPVHLLVITKEKAETLAPSDMFWDTLPSNTHPAYKTWPPLVSVYQALWRLSPRSYFWSAYHFPLKRMPVVLLCDDHLQIVEDTHIEIPLGEVQVEHTDNGVVAKAAGTHLVMRST
ncbi:MAG: hypothetical protein DRG71_07665 [Deltaproteobacteria bacterium]|nr:MAG: hypothetical protein DRG71_07665 [Deltaproteobacteria bacterium]